MPITAFLGAPRAGAGVLGFLVRSAGSSYPRPPLFAAARAFATVSATNASCWRLRSRTSTRGLESRISRHLSSSIPRLSAPAPSPVPPPVPDSKVSQFTPPSLPSRPADDQTPLKKGDDAPTELHESPYTLPNALTIARIAACPFLAWAIVKGDFEIATAILVTSGLTDWLDGYLARRWNQKTVLGSIIDPMADKTLVTTLVVCLTYKGLLPLPLAIIIFGRDFALSMWAFYLRYQSLPPPRTLKRYFDPTMPSAEVKPTQISKINTALQLLLMGVTTVSPILAAAGHPIDGILEGLQWIVAGTTIWSGLSYVGASGYKFLKPPSLGKKP